MAVALSLIILACATLIVLAFVTGRVSAMTRRTYLPAAPVDDARPHLETKPPGPDSMDEGPADSDGESDR